MIYIYGVKPQDEEWLRMKAVFKSCLAAGVEVPKKVLDYFNFDAVAEDGISDEGLIVTLADFNGSHHRAVTRSDCSSHSEKMEDEYVVDLTKLDPEIKAIKFVITY